MALPRFIVLGSSASSRYLSYVNDEGENHGFLEFSAEAVVNPRSKFEVEFSATGMASIRSCYNNKYWVRESENSFLIVAAAEKPEEDISKWSCTLFEPIQNEQAVATIFRFRHIQLNRFAHFLRTTQGPILLYAELDRDDHTSQYFPITDWESLVIFPKYVAFKDHNGNYLGPISSTNTHLQFSYSDVGDQRVGHEIFTYNSGGIALLSNFTGRVWRRGPSPDWVVANDQNPLGTTGNADLAFVPVKIGGNSNVVALRSNRNSNFCQSVTAEGNVDCLNANTPTISNEARLQVEELVLSRSIYNIQYRLMDARIYSESILTMANGVADNDTQATNNVSIRLAYKETRTNTWNASVSLMLGVTASWQVGIPLIASKGIEVTGEFRGEYQWGQTNETTLELETSYGVVVPPMSRVRVSLLATQGTCDVPFSYTQRDVLINGQQVITTKDDGVFTGINCFNFHYATQQEDLIMPKIAHN